MKKKISLRMKLTVLVCLTIIPLNVIVVVLSGQLIKNTERQLVGSFESGLKMLLERQQRDIALAEIEIQNLFEERKLEQISQNRNTRQSAYLIWQCLQRIREKADFMDAFYLTLYQEQEVYMTHHPKRMTNQQMQQLKTLLKDYDWIGDGQGQIGLLSCGEDTYFIGHLEYSNYGIGYLIRDTTLFEAVLELSEGETGVCIRDADGEVKDSWNMEQSEKEPVIEICCDLWESGHTIHWYIPRGQVSTASRNLMYILGALIIVSIAILPILWGFIRRTVLAPLDAVSAAIAEVKQDHLDYRISRPSNTAEFEYVYDSFNHMIMEMKLLRVEKYEHQIEKLKLEAENLRLQVNPHLLLNSFNMIFNMARSKNYESIQEYTLHLVDYFRYALEQGGDMVKVRAEMKFVSDYLKIQKMRYPDAIVSDLFLEETCQEREIPPLLIENFVENSVKYGRVAGQPLQIKVGVRLREGALMIRIEDNGVGFEPEVLEKVQQNKAFVDDLGKSHIGICNCRRRLRLFYGEQAELTIKSEPGMGASVCIRIGQEAANDNTDRG